MKIGFFTSITGWGGSEMYLLRLMLGVRERGHGVLLFGVAGTRLWEEAGAVGIERVAWRSIQTADGRQRTDDGWRPDSLRGTGSTIGKRTKHEEPSTKNQEPSTKNQEPSTKHQEQDSQGLQSAVCGLPSKLKRFTLKLAPSALKLLAGNIREVFRLRRLFKATPVDVMHVNVHGYEVAGIACRMVGVPSVGVFCNSWVTPTNVLMLWLTNVSLRFYSHIVGKSNYCLQSWLDAAKVDAAKGSVVYNGTDIASPQTHALPAKSSPFFQFVSVGRLDPVKAYHLLIEAFAMADLPDAVLVIVGEGPHRKTLEQRIAHDQLENRVKLPGHVENVQTFLAEGHVFVLPSISHESFGQSIIEAMATGLPVVTSDFGPFPEINVHNETGLVVPAGNVKRLSDALKWMVDHRDSERLLEMGRLGRERVVSSFSNDRMCDTMFGLYNSVGSR